MRFLGVVHTGQRVTAELQQNDRPVSASKINVGGKADCANHDPRAEEILTTAYHLLQERAAAISEEELRRSFLENVATHREIVRLFESGE